MAKPSKLTVTGVTTSSVVPLDYQTSAPFNVSLWVQRGTGCTYSIQLTCDDVQAAGYTPSSGFWVDHPSATGLTTDCAVSIAYPATGVRVNQTVGAAASYFTVIQQGVAP
jgi:hypothetical protein